MKLRIVLLIMILITSLMAVSCDNDDDTFKEGSQKYKENLKKYQKNSITPEQREKMMKQIFPNYKGRKN